MENPSSQPQYFRLNDAPPEAPKPWFRRPEVLKRIAFIGGVLLGVIFLGIFVKNLVESMSSGPKSELEAAKEEMAQRQAECDEEDEACKAQAQKDVARASGVAAACEGLEEKKKESCVTLIAREKKDAESCKLLSGDAQSRCTDSVIIARVADGEGMSACEDISAEKKVACENVVKANARSSGDCAKFGVAEEVCDERAMLKELLATGNFAGCAELSEELREECLDLFSSTDADEDGLTAKEEAEVGTSDKNADTDGDGYSDGTEVESGYNPLE